MTYQLFFSTRLSIIQDETGLLVPNCVAKYPEFDRCLLGRGGWLQSVRFGLVAYDDHLFLSLYDE